MVIVECLTDNANRTIGDVRACFTKTKCKLGTPGSVSHLFDHSAILAFAGSDEEAALEALVAADVDVTDLECEGGRITVFVPTTEHYKGKTGAVGLPRRHRLRGGRGAVPAPDHHQPRRRGPGGAGPPAGYAQLSGRRAERLLQCGLDCGLPPQAA